jgi:hypothetical protein
MSQNLYDLERITERARAWRREGDVARLAEMRAFCLEEARRCDEIVRRSLETPALFNDSGKAVSI